ncbi:MAG: FMN-binding protein [Spirochaetes bacterium]|nr:FMN-binding protein [Spirochaetota bacterium]
MNERQPAAYYALIGLSLVFSVLAVVTLLPNPSASKPNVLGYRSVCTFAPAATALCGLLAGITCILRNRLVSARRVATRFQPPFVAILVLGALVAAAAVFGARFSASQSRFAAIIADSAPAGASFASLEDGTRLATVSEGEVSATVEITVAGGSVTGLRLVEGTNVEQSVADVVFAAVEESQSSAVDAVSGATASSNVLLKAIEEATAGR